MVFHVAAAAAAIALVASGLQAQSSFVNWESPHVHPIDVNPDGTKVVAVNTADNRLEVFDVVGITLVPAGSVPVGLEPVSVRARTNTEIWVANHLSDSVSVVDLTIMNTVATIATGDEPADVVFAGTPQRAFVTLSQLNQVKVYDPANLAAPPVVIDIEGEDPRAMAVAGGNVYVAIFESGNGTTIVNELVVSSALNPYAGQPNPPPNDDLDFDPAQNPANEVPPEVSIIVKRQPDGTWLDDNGRDWSSAVTWDLHDHDIAVIDAGTLSVSRYVTGCMNLVTDLAVRSDGIVVAVGTEADNHVRFEPNVEGVFARVVVAAVLPNNNKPILVNDLNPHLTYTPDPAPLAPAARAESIGDPRGIAITPDNLYTLITGMGSNNLSVWGPSGRVIIPVGQGPTGVVLHPTQPLAYVLNRFEATVSVIDGLMLGEDARYGFYDPTPDVIKTGRPHLFDTHKSSALGHLSCATCHVDARMDQIAWDLGNPAGDMIPFEEECIGQNCPDFHPMKGPMTTQTLQGIIGTEPFHWRGDRFDLAAFNPAFVSLMGLDDELTPTEMMQFEAYVATITFPPNPNRNLDNTLKTSGVADGDAEAGVAAFMGHCLACHAFPTGTNSGILAAGIAETQNFKVAQLRNIHEKMGFDQLSTSSNKGFGILHDGSIANMADFLSFFQGLTPQERLDIESLVLSWSMDTHAGTGAQATVDDGDNAQATAARDTLVAIADAGGIGLVFKGRFPGGNMRGGYYLGGGVFQTDRNGLTHTLAQLDNKARPGGELTYTLVPFESRVRIGVDRDEDGVFDRTEAINGTDPADPDDF